MKKNFNYFGYRVNIVARQADAPESSGLWLANIQYCDDTEPVGDEQWIGVDRGAQKGYVDSESAIKAAELEIQAILRPASN